MRSRVGAVLGAILLSLTAAAVARAGPPSSGEGMQYYWLICSEGTATTATVYEIGGNHGTVRLRYAVTPCAVPTTTTAMAMGFYHPDGHAEGKAHPYGFDVSDVPPGAQATCLLASPQDRLDCYELLWEGNEVTVGQRVSPTDPRVAAIPQIELYLIVHDHDDPDCPLCA